MNRDELGVDLLQDRVDERLKISYSKLQKEKEQLVKRLATVDIEIANIEKHFNWNQEPELTALEQKIIAIVQKKGECTMSQIRSALGGSNCEFSAKQLGDVTLKLVDLKLLQRVLTKQGVKVKYSTIV